MNPFKKYLDRKDLEELRARQKQINEQLLIVQSLEITKQNWIANKFSKYGLDSSKKWLVDPDSGQIKEQKDEPKEKLK